MICRACPLFDMTHRYLQKWYEDSFRIFSRQLLNLQDTLKTTFRQPTEKFQKPSRLLPDTLKTPQILYSGTSQYLNMIAPGGWGVGGSPPHNHTTSWPNLQVENLQELKLTWVPSWARVWQKSYQSNPTAVRLTWVVRFQSQPNSKLSTLSNGYILIRFP